MKLLKIVANNYKLCDKDFTINFIPIGNKTMDDKEFELEKIDENYHIKQEIVDINPELYMDDVFYDKKNLSQPRIQDEEILIIKE